MRFNQNSTSLERIATALERIADTLESRHALLDATEGYSVDPSILDGEITSEMRQEMLRYLDGDTASSDDVFDDETPDADPIKDFLTARGITIKTVPPENPADPVINQLSLFLGERYDNLKEILAIIKRHMQHGKFFKKNIKGYSQHAISDTTQFCTNLHTIAYLEQYNYLRSPVFTIQAKTTTLPKAQNFFSGQWLERFVLQKVQSIVEKLSIETGSDLDFSYLLNPQIILPNGDDFELDLLFQVNNHFFWIEAKSGDYQQHIAKYSMNAGRMKLDKSHSIMVLTDIAPNNSAALSSVFNMTVYSLHQLEEGLMATMRKELI